MPNGCDPVNAAVLRDQETESRLHLVFQNGRLLRTFRRRCRSCLEDFRTHAHEPQQRRLGSYTFVRVPAPCRGPLRAQDGGGGLPHCHLRTGGRPEACKGYRQARYCRNHQCRHRDGRIEPERERGELPLRVHSREGLGFVCDCRCDDRLLGCLQEFGAGVRM